MTLSGAWDKLRTDPVVRFLVVSVAFYGMACVTDRRRRQGGCFGLAVAR